MSDKTEMNDFLTGAGYLFAGFQLMIKPGIKRYAIIPLCINILLFAILFFVLRHFMSEFNHWFAGFLPTWLQWLSIILWLLFFVSFFLIFIFTFVTFANMVASPFNSLLAEKVELFLTGRTIESRGMIGNIKDVPRILGRQFALIFYYVPRAVLLFVLFFIPVVQAFATIIWFVFNAWWMALTYFDYPTDNHRVTFQAEKEWLGKRKWLALGFGLSVLIATMIPILNLFVIPAAVAGATKCWVDASFSYRK